VADSGDTVFVQQDLQQTELRWPGYDVEKLDDGETESTVRVPINGRIAKVFVREGERIEKGARIAVIEAMKMEHMLVAPRAGTLVKLAVAAGEQVTQGALVASIVPDPAAPATNPSHSGGKSR
jgi:3-methylcrotonyl-CoA carboxylase alpha subunit